MRSSPQLDFSFLSMIKDSLKKFLVVVKYAIEVGDIDTLRRIINFIQREIDGIEELREMINTDENDD